MTMLQERRLIEFGQNLGGTRLRLLVQLKND